MEDLFEKVNRYVEGKMEPAEKQDFEAKCHHDPKTAAALKLWTDLDNMDQSVETELNLREQLKDIHQQLYSKESAGRSIFFSKKSYWIAAASIAALLILVISISILSTRHKPTGNEELFALYFKPEQLMQISRSAGQPFAKAVRLFQQADYAAAAASFNQLLKQDTANYRLMLYSGLAETAAGNYEGAIIVYQDILKADANLYSGYARWFLALVHIRTGQTDTAIEELGYIAHTKGHPFKKEATELSAILNKRR
ncbi:MAG: tetratricopeptide repeat protein [Bacteroidales bacterium]|jgi:hypothetical protein|nr:tetratricopeptide repeat protein [Bacteroidales bacterium]MDY0086508.1 tetratricopeptide repeat protein [Bacteroidales bacterium]HOI31705.1 tetratricopeptide repeat protein [Bacteroidales bacterium]